MFPPFFFGPGFSPRSSLGQLANFRKVSVMSAQAPKSAKRPQRKVSKLRHESPAILPYEGPIKFGKLVLLNLAGVKGQLAQNVGNRPKRPPLIRQYADDMLHGRWGNIPTIIWRDSEGNSHNGQHTLLAVERLFEVLLVKPENAERAKALRDWRLLVGFVEGIEPTSANYIDNGASRTPADMVGRRGLFLMDDFSDYLGKSPATRWPAVQKAVSGLCQFAERAAWMRALGLHPRASIGKMSVKLVADLECLAEYSVPAATYAFDASEASTVSEVVIRNGKSAKKKTKVLPGRIGPGYLAAVHVLVSSAYGEDGVNALDSIVELLSVPDLATADSLVSHSATLQVVRKLWLSRYKSSKGGGNAALNEKFVILLRAVSNILEGDGDADHLSDPIERSVKVGEKTKLVPVIDRIGGLDSDSDGYPEEVSDHTGWNAFFAGEEPPASDEEEDPEADPVDGEAEEDPEADLSDYDVDGEADEEADEFDEFLK